MPTTTKPNKKPEKDFSPGRNPGEDSFENIINREFSSSDVKGIEDRAARGAARDIASQSNPDNELAALKSNEATSTKSPTSSSSVSAQEQNPWQTEVGDDDEPDQQGSGNSPFKNAAQIKKVGMITSVIITLTTGLFGLIYGLINSLVISFKENNFEWSMKRGYTKSAQRAVKTMRATYFANVDDCEGIRCRYRSGVDKGQIKKLERMGVKVEAKESATKKGRFTISKMTLSSGVELNKDNFEQQFKDNKSVRQFTAKARDISGSYARTSSMVKKMFFGLGMKRSNFLDGKDNPSKSDFKKSLRQRIFGLDSRGMKIGAQPQQNAEGHPVGNEKLVEGLNEEIEEAAKEEQERLANDPEAKPNINPDLEAAEAIAKGAPEEAVKGGIKGSKITGALEYACDAFGYLKAGDIGAKILLALAYARYAQTFMAFAGAMQDGKATPAQIALVVEFLLSTDSEGRNFFDSPGFQAITYGVRPTQDEWGKYVTGSNGGSLMTQTRNFIDNATGGNATAACKIINNPAVQIGTGLISIAGAIFSGGATLALSVAGGAAAGAAFGTFTAYITPLLIQMAAGTAVSGDENGYQAGTAIASGMAAFSSHLGRSQGLVAMDKKQLAQEDIETNQLYNDFFGDNKPTLTDKVTTNIAAFGLRTAQSLSVFEPQNMISYTGADFSSSRLFAVNQAEPGDGCTDPDYEGKATYDSCSLILSETTASINDPKFCPQRVVAFMTGSAFPSEEVPAGPGCDMPLAAREPYLNKDGQPESNESGERYKNFRDVCLDGTAPLVDTELEDVDTDGKSVMDYCSDQGEEATFFRRERMDMNLVEDPKDVDKIMKEATGLGGGAAAGGPAASCGTAQECAAKILASPNLKPQTPEAEAAMKETAATGKQSGCGGVAISPILLAALLGASTKYKIVYGSQVNGRISCNDGQHPLGKAIDINGVSTLDGTVSTGERLWWETLDVGTAKMASDFVTFLASQVPAGKGGMGQKGCKGLSFNPPSGMQFFGDSCDHLHFDVRGT